MTKLFLFNAKMNKKNLITTKDLPVSIKNLPVKIA